MEKRKKSRAGRKTLLTDQLQAALCKYIRVGVPMRDACLACGISESVFYYWQERAVKEKQRKYVQFLEAIEKAKSESKIRSLVRIDKAALEDWRADAWLLERRYPEEFGKRDQVKIHQAEKGESFSPPGSHARLLEEIRILKEERQKYIDEQQIIDEDDD